MKVDILGRGFTNFQYVTDLPCVENINNLINETPMPFENDICVGIEELRLHPRCDGNNEMYRYFKTTTFNFYSWYLEGSNVDLIDDWLTCQYICIANEED